MECILVFSLLSLSVCLQKNPKYYLDNGGDRTVVYHSVSLEEKNTLQSTILAMLNLPKRPKYIKNPMKKSASRFLLDIYKIISDEEEQPRHQVRKRNVDSNLYSYLTMEELHKSDMIMAFSVRNVKNLGNLKGKVFWIDVKNLKRADQLLRAELRIYKLPGRYTSSNDTGKYNNIIFSYHYNFTQLPYSDCYDSRADWFETFRKDTDNC